MRILIFLFLTSTNSLIYANQYEPIDFFVSIPYEELPIHEMLELSEEEHARLINEMKNKTINLSSDEATYSIQDGVLKIKLIYGGSLELYVLNKSEGGYLGVMNSFWGQVSSSQFYEISVSGQISKTEGDLGFSNVYENDLLLPEHRFPESQNDLLIISPSEKGVFVAHTNGWHIRKWETKEASFSVTFKWDGRVFQKNILP